MRKFRNALRRPGAGVYWSPEAARFLVNRAGLRSRERLTLWNQALIRTRQAHAEAAAALLQGEGEAHD